MYYNCFMAKIENVRDKFKEILDNTFIRNYEDKDVKDNKIKVFSENVHNLKPEKLYRYRKFDSNSIDALYKNLVTTSKPYSFNDPFDSLIYVDSTIILDEIKKPRSRENFFKWLENNPIILSKLSKKELKLMRSVLKKPQNQYNKLVENVMPKIKEQLEQGIVDAVNFLKTYPNIACFSETQTSPTMWAHYADSHQGFVLEYNLKNYNSPCSSCSLKCNNEHYELLFPVIYSNERFNAKDFIAAYWAQKQLCNLPSNIFIPKDDELAIYKILLYKSLDWEYEKEWRIISLCNNMPAIIRKPTGIYLGANMPAGNKGFLKDFANKNNIPVYEMYIEHNSKEYAMNYK